MVPRGARRSAAPQARSAVSAAPWSTRSRRDVPLGAQDPALDVRRQSGDPAGRGPPFHLAAMGEDRRRLLVQPRADIDLRGDPRVVRDMERTGGNTLAAQARAHLLGGRVRVRGQVEGVRLPGVTRLGEEPGEPCRPDGQGGDPVAPFHHIVVTTAVRDPAAACWASTPPEKRDSSRPDGHERRAGSAGTHSAQACSAGT